MDNLDNFLTFDIYRTGCNLEFIQNNSVKFGRVFAIFKSTFYINIGSDFFCLGSCTLPNGPLNLVSTAPSNSHWPDSGLQVGQSVKVANSHLVIANLLRFRTHMTRHWKPYPVPNDWNRKTLKKGLMILRENCKDQLPEEGFACLISTNQPALKGNNISLKAQPTIKMISNWLRGQFQKLERPPDLYVDQLREIIGLGPGLTPSGDDLIAGMLIALYALKQESLAYQIWNASKFHVEQTGNPISLAHLKKASQGLGSEPVHFAIAAIMSGKASNIALAINQIKTIGHTSGWDALTGVILAFRVWEKYFSAKIPINCWQR